jgi:hypothetical protein
MPSNFKEHEKTADFLYYHMMVYLRETGFNILTDCIRYDNEKELLIFTINNTIRFTYQKVGTTIFFNDEPLIENVNSWFLTFKLFNSMTKAYHSAQTINWDILIPNHFVTGIYIEVEFTSALNHFVPMFIEFKNYTYHSS